MFWSLALLVSLQRAVAVELHETVKVSGFSCYAGFEPMIHLRSLETDREFYLANTVDGDPVVLPVNHDECVSLINYFSKRYNGQILIVNYRLDYFSRIDSVWVEPTNNSCQVRRTGHCNEGDFENIDRRYARNQFLLDGYKFFNETLEP